MAAASEDLIVVPGAGAIPAGRAYGYSPGGKQMVLGGLEGAGPAGSLFPCEAQLAA